MSELGAFMNSSWDRSNLREKEVSGMWEVDGNRTAHRRETDSEALLGVSLFGPQRKTMEGKEDLQQQKVNSSQLV